MDGADIGLGSDLRQIWMKLAATAVVGCLLAHGSAQGAPRFAAVLIAGDDSLPVFDNAVTDFRDALLAKTLIAPGTVKSLSAAQSTPDARLATVKNIVASIGTLHPAAGQGCLVYATSHGQRNDGVFLAADKVDLTPAELNFALNYGCGDAPTVVIISACFAGQFTTSAMRKPNRLILTAARPDRTSFGCQAGRRYTVFDRCLLESLKTASTWRGAFKSIRVCVAQEERQEHAFPSDPQAFFGPLAPDEIEAAEEK
jgi:hypothetical protein